MKFDTSKDFNNTFYVNKLYLTNTDPLLSQFMDNMQPLSIQKDEEERFVVKNIITEIKNKKRRR